MDTKWKKWKAGISFVCFLLGGVLLLASIPLGVVGIGNWSRVTDVFQSDYQNTNEFHRTISGCLDGLLKTAESSGLRNDYAGAIGDPNILYEVRVDGIRVYQSNPGVSLNSLSVEGYNFYLRFDGTKVSATKGGKDVDIYGDGYYRQGLGWNVPGFLNYPVRNENDKRVEVYLAAPAIPMLYPDAVTNTLYRMTLESAQNRQLILWICAIPAAGIVLFGLYILWRKDKKRADMAIAGVTGRIWAEFKLIFVAFTPLLLWMSAAITVDFLRGYIYGRPWVMYLLILPSLLLPYLYINDLRYNGWHKMIRQSLCGTLSRAWTCKELNRPVEKRLQRRAIAVFIGMTPFMLGTMAWGWIFRAGGGWFRLTSSFVLMLAGVALLLAQIYFLRESMADAHRVNEGMEEAISQRMKSERMKVELITNVSHDLKTPLTSVVSYAELLSREEDLPDHVKDYIAILNDKALRLKAMVGDVFAVSKAATGVLSLKAEQLDLGKLLRQTLADMEGPIAESGRNLVTAIPEEPVTIRADGDRLYRVFQNILQNALQYSLEGTRIYLTLSVEDGCAAVTLKNVSGDPLPMGVDLTERFVRGDESRSDGGSGLGLAIASSFTSACGGRFRASTDADLFTAEVVLPTVEE